MLYLVRHGRTEWNSQGRFQGQKDSPLLPEGRDQAAAAAAFLANAGVARIVSSPLGRSATSAAVIAEQLGLPVILDARLRECAYGVCEGLTRDEIEAQHPGLWAWRDGDKWSRAFPGGESYGALSERLSAFLAEQPDDATLCVVSHRGVSRAIAGLRLGWSPAETLAFHQDNGEIIRLLEGRLERIALQPQSPPSRP